MSGIGSANYITKWTGSTALGSSSIYNTGSNIGINTTTPEATFEINGNAIASPPTNSKHLATKGYVDSAVATTSNSLWTLSGSNLYASSTSWNVGIGTTSPAAKLHVVGTTTISGYLGIGVTSPLAALDIAGNIRIPTSNFLMFSDGRKLFYDRYYHSTGNFSFTHWNGSCEVYDMTLDNLGNVGIGTTSPGYVLDVNGGARFTGTVKVATPIDASDAVTKSYLDSALINSTSSNAYVLKAGDSMSGNLDMTGHNIVGINKLTVTTIDPLYDIDGIKYSTYAPSIVGGVKEEYVGRGEIRQCGVDHCSWRLDFSNQEKGSDLWVWRRIIDFQPAKQSIDL